ncbi:uncharacterized protein LOC116423664 [Sarcophilus harrisii]|uniref:uncharacterized protein LOC116423664 n=1 Tax=Sarcophilus harrisii TaxID=9305 RepID=UPI001301B0A0|nr:uncharacterized protein LOC116423664 [Sarcophilus harrisii]
MKPGGGRLQAGGRSAPQGPQARPRRLPDRTGGGCGPGPRAGGGGAHAGAGRPPSEPQRARAALGGGGGRGVPEAAAGQRPREGERNARQPGLSQASGAARRRRSSAWSGPRLGELQPPLASRPRRPGLARPPLPRGVPALRAAAPRWAQARRRPLSLRAPGAARAPGAGRRPRSRHPPPNPRSSGPAPRASSPPALASPEGRGRGAGSGHPAAAAAAAAAAPAPRPLSPCSVGDCADCLLLRAAPHAL